MTRDLYAKASSPFTNVKDAVDFAVANPGTSKWGGASAGSLERQILEKIKLNKGVMSASFRTKTAPAC